MTDNNQLDEAKIIGKRIRAKRTELEMTRAELAEASGLKVGTIERVEIGGRYPGAEHVMALAPVLGMSPNYMIFGDDSFGAADIESMRDQVMAMNVAINMLDANTVSLICRMVTALAKSRLPDGQLAIFDKMVEAAVSMTSAADRDEGITLGEFADSFNKNVNGLID